MLARRLVIVITTIVVASAFVVFFVWAPVVPFERQVYIEAPNSPVLCPGTQVCQTSFEEAWVRSYASLAYDAFGFGTPPYTGPVSLERNGVVTVFIFNGTTGTNALQRVAYPVSNPEPIPLLRINGLTIYPNGAPFGGTVIQISVTNLGVGETAEVSWGGGLSGSQVFLSGSQVLPAGATALINSTDWTGGPLPKAHTNYTVTLSATVHYAKFWLSAYVTQTVEVTYVSSP